MKKLIIFKPVIIGITLAFIIFLSINNIKIDKIFTMFGVENEYSEENFIHEIWEAMCNREEEFTVKYMGEKSDIEAIVDNVIDSVFEIDDISTSSDFDYLKSNFKGMKASVRGIGNIFTVNYQISYRETKEQTEIVDKRIEEIFKEYDIYNKDDYNKIKIIHDFIINNASYDKTYKNMTAYDNLILKSSVCQGYSSLFYKMATQANIPCRIIIGKANEENHSWNIVCLNGQWYNIDCTWDDPITVSGEEILRYDYFLKSDRDFKNHIRDKNYRTNEFYEKYNMSKTSYNEE